MTRGVMAVDVLLKRSCKSDASVKTPYSSIQEYMRQWRAAQVTTVWKMRKWRNERPASGHDYTATNNA